MRYDKTGLTIYDHEKATPGYTVITPLGQPNVYVINMRGEVVHQWKLPGEPGNYACLLPTGNLLAAVKTDIGPKGLPAKGGHLLEMDWQGNIVWEYFDHFQHHDFGRRSNGNTVYAGWELLSEDGEKRVKGGREGSEHPDGIYADYFREISPEGETVWEWHAEMDQDLERYPINPVCPRVEFCHVNTVFPLPNGDLLVNFRYNHLMAIIDRETKAFSWEMVDHSFGQQHGVRMLDNGNILFFANGANVLSQGPEAGSRVIELDPKTKEIVWQYKGSPPNTFFSWFIGMAQRMPNGNTVICEGVWGRIFEVTPEGETVWEYITPFIVEDHPVHSGQCCIFRTYRYAADSPEIGGRLPADPC